MTNRLLLDTSYLLPILGVEIEGLQKVLVKLQQDYNHKKVRLFFNRISLFEALAKVSKLDYDEARVQQGMQALLEAGIIEEVISTKLFYIEFLSF